MDMFSEKEKESKSTKELEDMLEELRKKYLKTGGKDREIVLRQAKALKYALGEK